MVEEAPLPSSVCGEIGAHIHPTALSWGQDDIRQTLIDAIVADANPEPHGCCRSVGTRRRERSKRPQHTMTGKRERNSETTGHRCDERRTRHTVDFAVRDLKTERRPLLGCVEFAKEIDGLDRSLLDVPASRA